MNDKEEKLNVNPIIDIENYPLLNVDKETSNILDKLFSNSKLISRKVRYFIISSNEIICSTETLEEYSYDDRKFVRINSKNNNDIFYWQEVKPIKWVIDNDINNAKITDISKIK